jgi:mannose/fructose/N-acetylgalactosamine-specific phosphotransferase system component IID
MVGLMVIGALVATWVNISTPLVYNFEETAISLQTTLDSIVPRLLPLLFTLGVLYGLRKKLSSLWIMAILIVIGVVGGYFGILG